MISFINNLQDFQYGKEIVQTTTTVDEDSDGALLELACVKASVVGKSSGQKCPYEFDSRPSYKKLRKSF